MRMFISMYTAGQPYNVGLFAAHEALLAEYDTPASAGVIAPPAHAEPSPAATAAAVAVLSPAAADTERRDDKKRRKPTVQDVFNQDDDGSDGPRKRKLGQ